jgi:ATP-dependent exoDNAse (exonuclease V) alpha subunit
MDKSKIREHLEEANQHVKKGEKLIEQQEDRIEELSRDGHPTKIHKENLEALREVEEAFKKNRDAIRKELEESREE